MTLRSCLRWKPTGKIFKTVGLRWVPTGKIFTSSTTKVDSESTNGSDEDITYQYEYKQTLDVSADTTNLSTGMTSDHNSLELEIHDHSNELSSSKLVQKVVPPADKTTTSRQELELPFQHHITMLSRSGAVARTIEGLFVSSRGGIMTMSLMHQWHDTICGGVISPLHSLLYGAYGCILEHLSDTYVFTMKMEILLEPTSNKLLDSYKDGDGDASFQLKSDSLPHAHAQTTKTYYKHQDSRIKEAQELKDKDFHTL
ncbi:hypothetical protein Tco_1004711 [Tanacetum coccineum]|uniref:Uncharacterized protein n=1 Tax=Tanacetum coccineum TaxID=301880 RepID=A0ABQ5FDX9_9ASTR